MSTNAAYSYISLTTAPDRKRPRVTSPGTYMYLVGPRYAVLPPPQPQL